MGPGATCGARPFAAALAACAALGAIEPAPAAAQGLGTTRVSAATATVHARCDPSSPTRAIVRRGDTVTIEAVNEGWVSVRLVGDGEQGCMRRSELEPTVVIDKAAQARRDREVARARGTPVRRAQPAIAGSRVIVGVNGSYQASSHAFDDTRTFDLYAEQGSFTADYAVEARPGLDAGAVVRLWRNLAAGVAFTSFEDERDIAVRGSLPHPLLFDRHRAVEGTVAGARKEAAVHVQAAVVAPLGEKVQVVLFGGPSFFTVEQSVVTGISYADEYPFDTARFTGADVATEEERKTGFNVGADVAYYFTRNVGVGGIVRFSQAKVTFSLGEVDAGGAMVGAGVRLRF